MSGTLIASIKEAGGHVDLVGATQLLVLALQFTHPGPLIGREPGPLPGISLGTTNPLT